MVKVFIIPGNGEGCDMDSPCMWYSGVRNALNLKAEAGEAPALEECVLRNMPDRVRARKAIWHDFMERTLQIGPDDIVVGHSSGAVAGVRWAETRRLRGLVLVGAYVTDLGDQLERESGYFDGEWLFDAVKANCAKRVIQFGSTDDPLLPWPEQVRMAEGLNADLRVYHDRGHFTSCKFPEAVDAVLELLD